MTHTFLFNGTPVPNLTMEEAVTLCRRRVLKEEKPVKLGVIGASGNHIYLGSYSPLPVRIWQPYADPSGNPVPQLVAEPAVSGEDEPVETIFAHLCKDGSYRLLINGKPDPRNRVFAGNELYSPKKDVREWFKNMKENGLFPFVEKVQYIER